MRLFIIFWTGTTLSLAADFQYNLLRFPKGSGNCHTAAADLVAVFEAGTQTHSVQVRASKDWGQACDISFFYEAAAPLRVVSTQDFVFARPRGRYKSIGDCNASLQEEATLFEAETKLKPVFAYCSIEELAGPERPWSEQITAFGYAEKTPHTSEFALFDRPVAKHWDAIRGEIQAAFATLGVAVRYIGANSSGVYYDISVDYYSKTRIPLNLTEYTRHRYDTQCLSQLESLKQDLGNQGRAPVSAFCGKSPLGEAELNLLYFDPPPVKARPALETFRSFEGCMGAKPQLLADYLSYHWNVLTGVCEDNRSPDMATGGYRVLIFEK